MENKMRKAAWLGKAGYGFFFHCLNGAPGSNTKIERSPSEWNARIDRFDVDKLARQLHDLGAGYFFLTVGQNSGYYCSPNEEYDRALGRSQENSTCSRRDLILDMAVALEKFKIPLLVYSTINAPLNDPKALEAFSWLRDWDRLVSLGKLENPRPKSFVERWERVHREWAERWGGKIKGWWLDGSYHMRELFDYPDEPNLKSFERALKAGSPELIVACNPGVRYPPERQSELEDYTAGEADVPFRAITDGPSIDGAQYHVLSYAGSAWGVGPLACSPEELAAATLNTTRHGGAMTWDVPLSDEDGSFNAELFDAFARMKSLVEKDAREKLFVPMRFKFNPDSSLDITAKTEGRFKVVRAGRESVYEGALSYHLPSFEQGGVPGAGSELEIRSGDCLISLPCRQTFDLRKGPLDATLCDLNKTRLANLRISADGDFMELSVQMFEKLSRVETRHPWLGSCFELFLSGDCRDGGVRQFAFVPDGRALFWNGKLEPAPSMKTVSEANRDGYRLKIRFPFSEAPGFDVSKRELFAEFAAHCFSNDTLLSNNLFGSKAPYAYPERFGRFVG